MDFSFPQVAAVVGLASVVVMLVYVAALRSQYRLAQAERARTIAAEAQLKEEQRLSRSMMDNTSDLMAIYRIDGDRLLISEWNRALRRFYAGREPEVDVAAWIGRPIDEFLAEVSGMDPEAVAQRLQPFRTAAATRQPVAYSTSIIARSRSPSDVVTSGSAIRRSTSSNERNFGSAGHACGGCSWSAGLLGSCRSSTRKR